MFSTWYIFTFFDRSFGLFSPCPTGPKSQVIGCQAYKLYEGYKRARRVVLKMSATSILYKLYKKKNKNIYIYTRTCVLGLFIGAFLQPHCPLLPEKQRAKCLDFGRQSPLSCWNRQVAANSRSSRWIFGICRWNCRIDFVGHATATDEDLTAEHDWFCCRGNGHFETHYSQSLQFEYRVERRSTHVHI